MPRFLIPWEIGAGFGHLVPILTIGHALKTRGHQVQVAARHFEKSRTFLEPHGIDVLPAPCLNPPQKPFPLSQNYGENLLRNGYWHSESLIEHLQSWLKLLKESDPDYVLCDHSPTALLAARHLNIPRAAYGVGFLVPPRTNPMPPLQPWLNLPIEYYIASEQRFLNCVNPVLNTIGATPLNCVADIFENTTTFLTIPAECDHYSPRLDEVYLGPLPYTGPDSHPQWPPGDGPRVFVYLSGYSRHLNSLFKALKDLGCSVLAYVRDTTHDQLEELETPKIRIIRELADLRQLAESCDAAVTYGGYGTLIELLRAAVPTLVLPLELEHTLQAYRLAERGLVYHVNFFNPTPDLTARIKQLLEGKNSLTNLEDFSRRCQAHNPQQVIDTIVTRCEMLC